MLTTNWLYIATVFFSRMPPVVEFLWSNTTLIWIQSVENATLIHFSCLSEHSSLQRIAINRIQIQEVVSPSLAQWNEKTPRIRIRRRNRSTQPVRHQRQRVHQSHHHRKAYRYEKKAMKKQCYQNELAIVSHIPIPVKRMNVACNLTKRNSKLKRRVKISSKKWTLRTMAVRKRKRKSTKGKLIAHLFCCSVLCLYPQCVQSQLDINWLHKRRQKRYGMFRKWFVYLFFLFLDYNGTIIWTVLVENKMDQIWQKLLCTVWNEWQTWCRAYIREWGMARQGKPRQMRCAAWIRSPVFNIRCSWRVPFVYHRRRIWWVLACW